MMNRLDHGSSCYTLHIADLPRGFASYFSESNEIVCGDRDVIQGSSNLHCYIMHYLMILGVVHIIRNQLRGFPNDYASVIWTQWLCYV